MTHPKGYTGPRSDESVQLRLPMESACKIRGCRMQVVGSSITGQGHVCRVHNNREWAMALARQSTFDDWRAFGQRWLSEIDRIAANEQETPAP